MAGFEFAFKKRCLFMILHMSISSSGCWIYMWVSSRIIKKRGMQEKNG